MESGKNIGKHEKAEKLHFFRRLFRFIRRLLILIVLIGVGMLIFLSVTEYKPSDIEEIDLSDNAEAAVSEGDEFTVMTWNTGYGALGDNADFFMDGGTHVKTADTERINSNMEGIKKGIRSVDPDVLFVQETDVDSTRSNHINEYEILQNELSEYDSSFANNFKVAFLPFPLPPIGKVDSGVATFTKYDASFAERIQLPIPFKWPTKMVNLKRCALETHVPVKGSDKELVLINVHLEAYDNGEGKAAQTKMLSEIMNEEARKGNYVIVGGDFNQFFSEADKEICPHIKGLWYPADMNKESFEGDWQFLTDSKVMSCRSLDKPYINADKENFQYYLIDGFIVSDNIDVGSVRNLDLGFVCSDHNPCVIKVKLK